MEEEPSKGSHFQSSGLDDIQKNVAYSTTQDKESSEENGSSKKASAENELAHSAAGGINNYESSKDDGSSEDEKLQKMVAIKSKEDYGKKPALRPAAKKPAALKGSARTCVTASSSVDPG